MSSTHTDKDSCRFRWTLSHSQVGTFPSLVSKVRLPVFFPEAVLPKDDCTSVAQEEQLVLRLNPNFFGLRLGVVSILVGILYRVHSQPSGSFRQMYVRGC